MHFHTHLWYIIILCRTSSSTYSACFVTVNRISWMLMLLRHLVWKKTTTTTHTSCLHLSQCFRFDGRASEFAIDRKWENATQIFFVFFFFQNHQQIKCVYKTRGMCVQYNTNAVYGHIQNDDAHTKLIKLQCALCDCVSKCLSCELKIAANRRIMVQILSKRQSVFYLPSYRSHHSQLIASHSFILFSGHFHRAPT